MKFGNPIVGLGVNTALFPQQAVNSGSNTAFSVPIGVRTLVFTIQTTGGDTVTRLVVGSRNNAFITQPLYYNQAPYLRSFSPGGVTPPIYYTVVVPIPPMLIPTANALMFTVTTAAASAAQVTIYGDTQAYTEDIYYNGTVQVVSGSVANTGTNTLATGPLRLLTVNIESVGTTSIASGITVGGSNIVRVDSLGPITWAGFSLPRNTIVPAGVTVGIATNGTGSGIGSISFAYP